MTGTNLDNHILDLFPDLMVYLWKNIIEPLKMMNLHQRFEYLLFWMYKSPILDDIFITFFRSLCFNLIGRTND